MGSADREAGVLSPAAHGWTEQHRSHEGRQAHPECGAGAADGVLEHHCRGGSAVHHPGRRGGAGRGEVCGSVSFLCRAAVYMCVTRCTCVGLTTVSMRRLVGRQGCCGCGTCSPTPWSPSAWATPTASTASSLLRTTSRSSAAARTAASSSGAYSRTTRGSRAVGVGVCIAWCT